MAKDLAAIAYGGEPIFTDLVEANDPRLIKAFNWYNYMASRDQAKTWLLQYMKKIKSPHYDAVKSAVDWRTQATAGWIAKMLLNGTTFTEKTMKYLDEAIQENAKYGEVKETKEKVVVDIQARIRSAADILLGEVEEMVDAAVGGSKINIYEFLSKKQASTQIANIIRAVFQKQLDEVSDNDEQVIEAYGNKRKFFIKLFTSIVEDCDRYANNKKSTTVRKPRKKKEVLAVDKVKEVKYQKEFAPLKISSVNPVEILGAESLWLYNTKYKTLTVLHASTRSGLSVKGTTVTDYDEKRSMCKTLRKPEETIKHLLSSGKIVQRKLMDSLSTKPSLVTGRINPQVIILKAVK